MFRRVARVEVLSVYEGYQIFEEKFLRKRATMVDIESIPFNTLLEAVSDTYKISTDPGDYIFMVQRALSANVPNKNMDAFEETELLDLKDDGRFTYETFIGVPLLREHRDSELHKAGGVVIGAYLDDNNEADKCVITLSAMDTKKWSDVSNLLRNGYKIGFSMGCMVGRTICSVCGNEARRTEEFCEHIRNKFGAYYGKAWEWCRDVWFRELSYVEVPADSKAFLYTVCSSEGKCVDV